MYFEDKKPKNRIFSGQNRKFVGGPKKDLILKLNRSDHVGLILKIPDIRVLLAKIDNFRFGPEMRRLAEKIKNSNFELSVW